MFRKPLGTRWEKSFSFRSDIRTQFNENYLIAHIGPGFVAAASERGISVYKATSMTYDADDAGYSPSRWLMDILLMGGSVRQMTATVTEQNEDVVPASQITIFEHLRRSSRTGSSSIALKYSARSQHRK